MANISQLIIQQLFAIQWNIIFKKQKHFAFRVPNSKYCLFRIRYFKTF